MAMADISRRTFTKSLTAGAAALATRCGSSGVAGSGEWPSWGRDPGGQRFSPIGQINKNNAGELRRAWVHHTGEISDGTRNPTRTAYECTPLIAGGLLYVTTPYNRLLQTTTKRAVLDGVAPGSYAVEQLQALVAEAELLEEIEG